jgi:hypothetical protein
VKLGRHPIELLPLHLRFNDVIAHEGFYGLNRSKDGCVSWEILKEFPIATGALSSVDAYLTGMFLWEILKEFSISTGASSSVKSLSKVPVPVLRTCFGKLKQFL